MLLEMQEGELLAAACQDGGQDSNGSANALAAARPKATHDLLCVHGCLHAYLLSSEGEIQQLCLHCDLPCALLHCALQNPCSTFDVSCQGWALKGAEHGQHQLCRHALDLYTVPEQGSA